MLEDVVASVSVTSAWSERPKALYWRMDDYPRPFDAFSKFVEETKLELIHVVRFAYHLGLVGKSRGGMP